MTNRTRYFFIGASLVLLLGIGVGLVAYYRGARLAQLPGGLPDELRYVPATAELVAYADVQTVMNSELRRELERAAGPDDRPRGKHEFNDFAGIDFEKQVHHIVAYLDAVPVESSTSGSSPAEPRNHTPQGLVVAQGTFDQAKIEQFIGEHGGTIEDYHGKRLSVHRADDQNRGRGGDQMAVGFLQPNLLALGHADLVRRAIDRMGSASATADVTTNDELMRLVRDAAGETAWVVGNFDAFSRRMGMPNSVRAQVPPLRMVAAKAHINGGVKATIKAETADQAAADQMRDVIRGFVSLARMQTSAKPELQNALKTLELGGTGSTVQLTFAMSPETFRAVLPHRPDGRTP